MIKKAGLAILPIALLGLLLGGCRGEGKRIIHLPGSRIEGGLQETWRHLRDTESKWAGMVDLGHHLAEKKGRARVADYVKHLQNSGEGWGSVFRTFGAFFGPGGFGELQETFHHLAK